MTPRSAASSVFQYPEPDGHLPFAKEDLFCNQPGVHGAMNIVATDAPSGFAILDMNIMEILFTVSETRRCCCGFVKEQPGVVAGKTDKETLLIRRGINLCTVCTLEDEGIGRPMRHMAARTSGFTYHSMGICVVEYELIHVKDGLVFGGYRLIMTSQAGFCFFIQQQLLFCRCMRGVTIQAIFVPGHGLMGKRGFVRNALNLFVTAVAKIRCLSNQGEPFHSSLRMCLSVRLMTNYAGFFSGGMYIVLVNHFRMAFKTTLRIINRGRTERQGQYGHTG